jgi:hypothetical protein
MKLQQLMRHYFRVMENFQSRFQECVMCRGEHLKNCIFKNEYDPINCIILLLFL